MINIFFLQIIEFEELELKKNIYLYSRKDKNKELEF